MKNKDIYDGALKILAEKNAVGANDDYEERAPYLIAAFCSESASADAAYRRANYLPAANPVSEVYVDLASDFPCSTRFAAAACTYLASMLIIDDDTELSDKLFDKYSDIMSAICSEIPALIEDISDRYSFL